MNAGFKDGFITKCASFGIPADVATCIFEKTASGLGEAWNNLSSSFSGPNGIDLKSIVSNPITHGVVGGLGGAAAGGMLHGRKGALVGGLAGGALGLSGLTGANNLSHYQDLGRSNVVHDEYLNSSQGYYDKMQEDLGGHPGEFWNGQIHAPGTADWTDASGLIGPTLDWRAARSVKPVGMAGKAILGLPFIGTAVGLGSDALGAAGVKSLDDSAGRTALSRAMIDPKWTAMDSLANATQGAGVGGGSRNLINTADTIFDRDTWKGIFTHPSSLWSLQ